MLNIRNLKTCLQLYGCVQIWLMLAHQYVPLESFINSSFYFLLYFKLLCYKIYVEKTTRVLYSYSIMLNQMLHERDTPIPTLSHKHTLAQTQVQRYYTRTSHLARSLQGLWQICGCMYYDSWLKEQLLSFIANHHTYHICRFSYSTAICGQSYHGNSKAFTFKHSNYWCVHHLWAV